ncbi:MAG: leucine--tRNA ligase [Puniceicoccales bacterium]|jgi:leucyl-tRNA synthetase|nr:leucine--tRNA ligase [Puniceicoccales bacterium]
MVGRIYDFKTVEEKWQKYWREKNIFRAEDFSNKPRYYALDMFPYPSGAGLHIGHPEGYTASDILSRYFRALGYNVLHPMGWDAFGLPAEQHAIQTGTDPRINTQNNVDTFRRQIQRIGFAIDWSREINTTDPRYYRWTQWIFLQLFRHNLTFVDKRPVWWCPALKSVLANEEVVDGLSERGNYPVVRRPMRQWILRITAYAEKLLEELNRLDWPDSTKRQQIAWIGRSQGAEVDFPIHGVEKCLSVYTTRPDTLLGATYLVVAPEHPLLEAITVPERWDAVREYQQKTARKSDLDRTDLAKIKTGVFSGAHAIHPLTGEPLPIWVSDYVLMSYGSGAIMCVPAHDTRDFEFAQLFHLPVRQVIRPLNADGDTALPYCERGILCNSGEYDGMTSDAAQEAIIDRLMKNGTGRQRINYKLRDWLFSRQRYWGEPIPIVWVREDDFGIISRTANSPFLEFMPSNPVFYEEDGRKFYAVPLCSRDLPLNLPPVESYLPSDDGESPLARASSWVSVWIHPQTGEIRPQAEGRPAGEWLAARRETNTMPQWAGSCWYHLRYMSPRCETAPVDPKIADYWRAPNFYIGGAEHAVLHLLYARFWHRFLYDIGVVPSKEPYPRLFHQGIILGEDGEKMSKSRGNVINPDAIIQSSGADSLRLYEMFLGPLEAVKPWDAKGIEGVIRFLKRTWKFYNEVSIDDGQDDDDTQRLLHESIRKVREDIEGLRFNTAISQLMILLNRLQKLPRVSRFAGESFIQLLAPFAPHICEEIWEQLGHGESIACAPFPNFDIQWLTRDTVTIVVQINGKRRGEIFVPANALESEVLEKARTCDGAVPHLRGRRIVKEVHVPHRIVNFVVQ